MPAETIREAARRSESETREWVAEKLDESVERYRRFFSLARSGERVAPTRDIDMVWRREFGRLRRRQCV